MMTTATTNRLEALRNRSTTYEIVLTCRATADTPAREVLLAYAPKSKAALLRAVHRRGADLVAYTGCDRMFDGEVKGTIAIGIWTIKFTGRTRREAIVAGERPAFFQESK